MTLHNRRKIDFLTLDFPPVEGGISRYLYEIVRHLPSNQVRVTAVAAPGKETFDQKQAFEINRLTVPSTWGKFQKQLKFFAPFYLKKLISQSDSAFLLCGQAHYSLMAPALFVSRLKKIPFGIFAYGLDLLYPQTTKYRQVFNYMLKAADIIFVDSEAAKEILLQLQVPSKNIEKIYPSIDLSLQQTNNDVVTTIKEKYALADKKCILTLGRLVERKGHDIVLYALPEVLQSVPDLHYLIVGKGPNQAHLEALIRELELGKYVTLVGFVPDEERGAFFAACDVFLMISREIPEKGEVEGFGIVYLEANLMGKAVVAGRSGGVPEAVLHEKTGLLVDPTSVQEVASAIIRVLNDQDLRHRLGETGRQRVLTEFNSEVAAKKVLSSLSRVS